VPLAYLREARLSVPRSTRALALLNVPLTDAGVAAWDAKYAYWSPRPENAVFLKPSAVPGDAEPQ
jgi:hypothetical protein